MAAPAFARDIMSQPVMTLSRDASVLDAAKFLLDNRLSGAPVLDDRGRVAGVFTFRDLAKFFLEPALEDASAPRPDPAKAKVSELMTKHAESVRPGDRIEDCRKLMRQHRMHRVLVTDDEGALVGIISATDLVFRVHEGV
ncbi:MAG: CBS domain-containing protein [Candidatus Brocadiae bacterium]|nr:CBS domain-containing protein [Candidatus Brocadiia bacterium]